MTKIKNFRITLRAQSVARLLKNQDKLQITPALEASIEHAVKEAKQFMTPAAVYTTLTRAIAEKATSIALPKSAIAVSVIAVTLGSEIDDKIMESIDRADSLQTSLLTALRQEGLAQSTQFAMRLILDQAKEEQCEISDPWPVQEAPLLPSLAALLGVQRIGLEIDPENPALPAYARMVWSAWTPIPKRSSKKSDATPRAAKVAV